MSVGPQSYRTFRGLSFPTYRMGAIRALRITPLWVSHVPTCLAGNIRNTRPWPLLSGHLLGLYSQGAALGEEIMGPPPGQTAGMPTGCYKAGHCPGSSPGRYSAVRRHFSRITRVAPMSTGVQETGASGLKLGWHLLL